MSSKEPRFTSHSVNITSSFIVYTQSSLWLHPCIVTEALIKLGIYEARILIIGDWAGWMMLFICRVLQLDESNLLSFKTPAMCSDHKLAYFSQIIKKDKTKKKNPHKSSGNSWLTESDLFPTADGQCLRNVVESLILLACHLLPSNMYTKACCSQEGGSIFGCFNDLVGFLKGCLLPACTILTRASNYCCSLTRQAARVEGACSLLFRASGWLLTRNAGEAVPLIRILKLIPTAPFCLVCLSWNKH